MIVRGGFKYGAGLLMAAMLLLGAHEATDNPRVCRFVRYYNAVKNTDAPVNFWERLVYSYVLSNANASTSFSQPDGGRQACERELHSYRSSLATDPSRL